MILSAIGLPMSAPSSINLPPAPLDRAEAVQAVGAAVATGGAGRSRDTDTNAGSGAGRQSARDEARMIRVGAGAPGSATDKIAGPQPAFEIAVLEKLREDAMRVPPESAEASDARPPRAEVQPTAPARRTAEDRATATDTRATAAEEASAAPDVPRDALREPARAERAERAEPDPALRSEAPRDRAREPADDGFDDARRMSEERSPPRIDVVR